MPAFEKVSKCKTSPDLPALAARPTRVRMSQADGEVIVMTLSTSSISRPRAIASEQIRTAMGELASKIM